MNKKDMQQAVDAFNEICRPGDPVIVEKDGGEIVKTTLRHPAQIMSGELVAWANGISGCYLLDRFTVANGIS